eukprot:11162000-Lingulodinium_polyedra.AAC.1
MLPGVAGGLVGGPDVAADLLQPTRLAELVRGGAPIGADGARRSAGSGRLGERPTNPPVRVVERVVPPLETRAH